MKALKLISAVVICLAAGFIGSIFTTPAIPTWYAGLNKPSFSPPNWIFAPVWTTLFILMGIAVFLVWEKRKESKLAQHGIYLFSLQLAMNTLWSILFFGMQSPLAALFDIAVLWVLILACIITFWKISRAASWLMLSYLLWVSFASVLNVYIVLLNR